LRACSVSGTCVLVRCNALTAFVHKRCEPHWRGHVGSGASVTRTVAQRSSSRQRKSDHAHAAQQSKHPHARGDAHCTQIPPVCPALAGLVNAYLGECSACVRQTELSHHRTTDCARGPRIVRISQLVRPLP
jgi:hypothetical protein